MTPKSQGISDTAERILALACNWIDQNPGELPTTRKLCELAGVSAPTLYHHFGDKEGLLVAIADKKMQAFLQSKKQQMDSPDPEADLLKGWNQWLEFARSHKSLVMSLQQSPSISARIRQGAEAVARARLERIQELKPLSIPPDQAAQMAVAASNVVVQLMYQGMPETQVNAVNRQLQTAILLALTERQPSREASRKSAIRGRSAG